MEEISQTQNLNAHYTASPKVAKPQHIVVNAPNNIPQYHIYTDREANERLSAVESDVYEAVQRTPKKKNKKKFFGIF